MTDTPTEETHPAVGWRWIDAHYRMAESTEYDGDGPPPMLCRRCGAEVDWMTKHAVERHGDTDIKVQPPVREEPEGGWKW